jgi:hypothetical protein
MPCPNKIAKLKRWFRRDKPVLVTDDAIIHKGGKLDPSDETVLQDAKDRGGVIIRSTEQLMELAKGLSDIFDQCVEFCRRHMTKDQAEQIRKLRLQGYSWRAVARACHGLKWWPANDYWDRVPSAQPMGMALCEVAAEFFGEDYMKRPWN